MSKSKTYRQSTRKSSPISNKLSSQKIPFRLSLLLLAFTLITAGCIGQGDSPAQQLSANGLVIKNMYIDPPQDQLQSGELITIRADLENLGSSTAKKIEATLVGAAWLTTPALAAQVTQDDLTEIIPQLTPPDPRFGLPGQSREISFRIPAPLLAEGQKATFDIKIRVKFDYETSAVVQIPGYNRERYNSLFQQGKLTPPTTVGVPVQTSPNAPVGISVIGPDKVIVGPGAYDEYTYQFTFANKGSEIPITPNVGGREEDGLISGTVWMQGPGVYFRRCLGVAPETLISAAAQNPDSFNNFFTSLNFEYKDKFSAWYQELPWGDAYGVSAKIGNVLIGAQQVPAPPSIQYPSYVLFPNALDWQFLGFLMDPIKLRKGQSVTKSCTVGILNNPGYPDSWANRPEDSIIINSVLKYRYFIDEPLKLTVTSPIRRSPGFV